MSIHTPIHTPMYMPMHMPMHMHIHTPMHVPIHKCTHVSMPHPRRVWPKLKIIDKYHSDNYAATNTVDRKLIVTPEPPQRTFRTRLFIQLEVIHETSATCVAVVRRL